MKNYFFFILCFSAFLFSCKIREEKKVNAFREKKAVGKLVTDSVSSPLIDTIGPPILRSPVVTTSHFSLDPHLGKESITTITPMNGLPLGSYYQVEQDRNGNLWFITSYELIKYDGNSFTRYPPLTVAEGSFDQLAIDKDGYVWVVIDSPDSTKKTRVSNLYIFDGITFKQLTDAPSGATFTNSAVIRLFPQKNKTIWIVNDKLKKLFHFDGRKLIRTINTDSLSFKMITYIETDNIGNTWFTDWRDSSLTRFDGNGFKKLTRKDGLPDAIIFRAIPISSDSLYLFTTSGTYLYNNNESKKIDDNPAAQSFLDDAGNIWIQGRAAGTAVQKLSRAGKVSIDKEDGLEITDNWLFGKDNENNVWVLSQNSINRLYSPVKTYENVFPPHRTKRAVRSFYFDKKGRYWFGSFLQGLSCYRDSTITNYSFLDTITSGYNTDNNIGSITEDHSGNIWIGTVNGSLVKFNEQGFYFYNKSNGFNENAIYSGLFADSKGNIWFPKGSPGRNKGVACFNGNQKLTYTTAQGLCDNNVRSIFEDRNGSMWFGTENGLSRLKDGRFTTFTKENGLAGSSINDITEDEYGNLWLGTNAGISRYNGESFTNYTGEQGLVDNVIMSIQKDPNSQLIWIASESGVTAMRPHANNKDSITFERYSEADGFPVKGGRDFLLDKEGVLWTSEGNNSLLQLDRRQINKNSKPFRLHITQIRLNNQSVSWNNLSGDKYDSLAMQVEMQQQFGKVIDPVTLNLMAGEFKGVRFDSIIPFDLVPYNLVLPYTANSISIDFAAIDPQFSKNTRYQFMLDGLDKNWSPLTKINNANYSNLREGNYTFKLKALNPYGIWSETSYSFKILPPWYRSWWSYVLYIIGVIGGIYLFIRWRTKKLKKEKLVLEEKVATRTAELNQSLDNLKATQRQLIQSEKMASLGELTAGIAHEIQNPLNFVNNFAEVNKELLAEIREEIQKKNFEIVGNLTKDVEENEEKIAFHGKRADAIVKGMLHHSRSSNGAKEPTDINALADEYLRFAYYGLRAKDKSFNAQLKTEFDDTIGQININPQDVGRVILNLINNAFYAAPLGVSDPGHKHEPTVWVSTKKLGDKIQVSVKDNGPGIPQKVLDKIFQPFFTTKPAGQGTGLGLSLSYDIIKAHGGELKVQTKEGEGSTFIMQLPVS